MTDEMAFRFQSFKGLMAAGWDDERRPMLSVMERGFCTAMDFDTVCVMEGFLHPFIYWPEKLPDAIRFHEALENTEIAKAISTALQSVVERLGEPSGDDFGDRLWQLLESEPEFDHHFEVLDQAWTAAPSWIESFDAFLLSRGIEPQVFWKT